MSDLHNKLHRRWLVAKHSYLRFTTHFTFMIKRGADFLGVITFIAALLCVAGIIVYFGFDHTSGEWKGLLRTVRAARIIFLANVIYSLTLNLRSTLRHNRIIKWVVDIAVLVTLLPLVYPRPEHPWIPLLEQILYSRKFIFAILAAYSVMVISSGIMKLLSRHTNPSLIMASSFMILIFIGSLLLMMPRCTIVHLNYIDSLFIATSAVSITGLCPVELSQTFTPQGLLILALLIQTGGLGIMTFTCFFALYFSGNTSVYSQLMVKDMIYSKSLSSLLPTLMSILLFTLVIELAGAVAFFLAVHGTLGMSLEDELIFSGFHAMSAFCNAGFSNLDGGLSNPLLLHSDQSVYIIASLLILAGGIGFPILMNFSQAARQQAIRAWRRLHGLPRTRRKAHTLDFNTKIVLVTSAWIIVASSALFFVFEYNNTLAGMSLYDKIVQSVFNSFVPRSSGFASVNPASMMNVTLIMFVFLMWVGGGSQSTAGGIKVNTFATMLLNLKASVCGSRRVTAFHRTIDIASLRTAHAVVGLSVLAYLLTGSLLVILDPGLGLKALLYEAASGLFTVGTSLGITPQLSTGSKIVLCLAMFFGRVGLLSVLAGIAGSRSEPPVKYPSDNIIIN